jgi:hypothetical protein
MKTSIKKYLSLFLLALFLFPSVEKQLHAFEHLSDSHCTSANKHFHPLEHNCSICDFTITDSNSSAISTIHFVISSQTYSFNPFCESVNTPIAFADIPARAPPVI